jgi:hypothetical protein
LTGKATSYNATSDNYTGVTGTIVAPPDSAMLANAFDVSMLIKKTCHMRFLPQEYITKDAQGVWTPAAGFQPSWTAYEAQLTNGEWYLRAFDKDDSSNATNSVVDAIHIDAAGFVGFELRFPFGEQGPGDKIKITNYRGGLGVGLNGLHYLTAVTDTKIFWIDKRAVSQFGTVVSPGGAWAWGQLYRFTPISTYAHAGPSAHDTGRPFFQRRGRRSKRPVSLFIPVVR